VQVDFLAMLGIVLGALLILAFGTVIPGLAAIRILDPTADRFRQLMLTPAIGLLLLLGLAGWSVLLFGVFSSTGLVLLILVMNYFSVSILRRKEERGNRRLSSWEKLEKAMGIERDEIEPDKDIWSEDTWSEVEEQRSIQASRPTWWGWAVLVAVIISLAPLFLFRFPHGVDWVGFATLTNSFANNGNLSLPPPSLGSWTYPPAFPALAALLQQSLNISPEVATHVLARIGLLCILLGIVGVCDRWGSGAYTLVAMGLAAGIFAKAHDSGWPTILSQLGLILGLLVVIRPAGNRRREHDFAFAIGVLSVAVIHPTGAIYLGTLLMANLIIRQLHHREDERALRIATISAIMLAIAAAVTFLLFAPRLLDEAVFAEYGWQGGWPMLIYATPLLPIALYCGWSLRHTVEGGIVLLWLLLQWLLTLVHLFDGISIPVFSLMSYSLYSMALHAFHIPAAVLLGMAFARGVEWTPIERGIDLSSEKDGRIDDETDAANLEGSDDRNVGVSEYDPATSLESSIHRIGIKWFVTLAIISGLFVAGSGAVLIRLGDHAELFVTTDGDREIAKLLSGLPEDSIVYVEKAHWGHVYDAPQGVAITTYPSLGIVDAEKSIQPQASDAIRRDNASKLTELGITHAISSPLGTLVLTLSESPHWKVMVDIDGARLWKFTTLPTIGGEGWFATPQQSDCESNEKCAWRIDVWEKQRSWQHEELSSMRPFIADGALTWNDSLPSHLPGNTLTIALLMECSKGMVVTVELRQGDWFWRQRVTCDLGWGYAYDDEVDGISIGDIQVTIRIDAGGGQSWLNPLGLSGRGDRVIDESGVRIHWLELRRAG
jgi:hypothetical protein